MKILEMMADSKTKLSEARTKYEKYKLQSVSVPCPWSRKGTVLRKLITNSKNKKREMIDGIRIIENGGWVLVTPDRDKASFNITSEASTTEKATTLLNRYKKAVEEFQS